MAALKLAEERIRREAAPAGHGAGAGAGCAAGNAGTGGDGEADGAAAPGAVEAAPAYVVSCPACRAEVPPSSLAFAWGPLQVGPAAPARQRDAAWRGGGSREGMRSAVQRSRCPEGRLVVWACRMAGWLSVCRTYYPVTRVPQALSTA